MPVSSGSMLAAEACARTVRRRMRQVLSLRDAVGVSIEDEVNTLSKGKREQLLKDIALPIAIPLDHTLTIKSNLSISWNKLRTLRR